ncbi:MAG: BrnT family toxin [Burkholderiales bacterium]
MRYTGRRVKASFEWDERKDTEKQTKHGIPFALAQYAFADPKRVSAQDTAHSAKERSYFCFGRVGEGILTVTFTYRAGVIRIVGAGVLAQGKGHL